MNFHNLKEEVSKIFYNAAKQTWINRQGNLGEVIVPFDDFSGIRAMNVSNLPEGTLMNIGFDGTGTKIEIAERVNNHETIPSDLFGMVCDDAPVRGAEPILIGTIFDVNNFGKNKNNCLKQVKQIAKGYVRAAKAANVVIINGETAELGNRVGGYGNFNYNWGAGVVWFANRERMFTGREIKSGDYLIGLKENGFRSNGLSLVRKIMQENFGDNWHRKKYQGKSLGEQVLTPSIIYTRSVVDMFGGWDLKRKARAQIHGISHITGGGLIGKLGRVLKPSELGAIINNPINPPEIMSYVQKLGKISDEEAYNTWNMGPGMVVISPEPEKVIKIAKEYGIDSQVIGEVRNRRGIEIVKRA